METKTDIQRGCDAGYAMIMEADRFSLQGHGGVGSQINIIESQGM